MKNAIKDGTRFILIYVEQIETKLGSWQHDLILLRILDLRIKSHN